jgi:undecaprenyl-diphosphatase
MPRATVDALVTAGVAAVLFVVLLVAQPSTVDWAVHSWIVGHRWPPLTAIAVAVTDTAMSAVVIPVVTVLCLLLCPGPLWRRLIPAVLMVIGILSRTGVSDLVARARPPIADWAATASGFSFPSGHTTDATLAAGVVAFVLIRRFPRRSRLIVIVAAGYAVAVGLTRVYLGVHWPSDVIGGWLFATVWLAAAHAATRRQDVGPPLAT